MEILSYEGTPREIGRAFGEDGREQTRQLYRLRIDNAMDQAHRFGGVSVTEQQLLELASRCWERLEAWRPEIAEELQGIAEGAGMKPVAVWAMNGLTDLRDLAGFGLRDPDPEGCTAALVSPERSPAGTLVAQTWDLATDNMPHVRVVQRFPKDGPATACLTLTGCLSLIGVNSEGVAVGTTNLRSARNRFGVSYLDVIHGALAASTRDEAIRRIETAPRAGAHFYYVADRDGAYRMETTAFSHVTQKVEGVSAQSNHFVEPSLVNEQGEAVPLRSSHHRLGRMQSLLAEGPVDIDRLKRALADDAGGELAIERHGWAGISTNGATVIHPGGRTLWAVHGPPSQGRWIQVSPIR
jgi:isopenicillin-N N-acyltransferase-like protein